MQTAPTALASEIEFNEAILRVAATHDRSVQFNYAKSDGAGIEPRVLKPQSIAISDDGAKLVIGVDPYRDDQHRSFRLDRIKGDVKVVNA